MVSPAEFILTSLTILIFVVYRFRLWARIRRAHLTTAIGFTHRLHRNWVETVMEEKRDVLAVQTLRNPVMTDGFVLDSHFGWAKEGGSVQVDLTYPLHRFLSNNFDIYLQAQYFNGLAESLLNYRERTEAFRLGLAIVR